jgi:hypothetical protein
MDIHPIQSVVKVDDTKLDPMFGHIKGSCVFSASLHISHKFDMV